MEIIAVLMVIGLISLVIVPGFTNFKPNSELEIAYRQVISVLREAQGRALETQLIQSVDIFNLALPENVTLQGTTFPGDTVSWGAEGLPDASGTVTLIASNGKTKTITITATGYIK